MFERIKKYKRYKDYYAVCSFEVRGAGILTVIFGLLFCYFLNFRELFINFQEDLKQIVVMIIGGEFTLLGMSLAGIAIIISLLSTEELKIIERVDKNNTVDRVLSRFEFSALNFGVQIVYLIIIYFLIVSDKEVMVEWIFWSVFVVIVYHFLFNLFYVVALVGSCIKMNSIKRKCYKISFNERSLVDAANEIRIEYLLAIILKDKGIRKEAFLKKLDEMVDLSKMSNKDEVKKYLKDYYG